MTTEALDVLFIIPNPSSSAYQDLAEIFSAIEPPTWALLLAESCRAKGFSAAILDCDAERCSIDGGVTKIINAGARLNVFVGYGQNPNSGTTSMPAALALAKALKLKVPEAISCFVGSHTSALPMEVLSYACVDIVLLNEGVYALHNLLKSNLAEDLPHIKGIGYKKRGPANYMMPTLNSPERLVPQDRMDHDLPGYAWDLLPYKSKPLDMYRAHFWHANFDHEQRTPFAAIYTSLGCNFGCDFCMINIVNRTDNSDSVSARDFKGMRFWSPAWVSREMRKLANLGVKTLRISDEMFFLNRKFYEPILQDLIEQQYGFNMWAYARVDTVRKDALNLFKKAGINWLALGIEAGNQVVRQEVSKGIFKDANIREVVSMTQNAGIKIIGNYMFGFYDDTLDTMNETLELALELNTEMVNMYPVQALPGSPLHQTARSRGWELPDTYEAYGFLSEECKPLPTKTLSPSQVLRFRDEAWQTYFSNPSYLSMVERTFGPEQLGNIVELSKIKLKRKILA